MGIDTKMTEKSRFDFPNPSRRSPFRVEGCLVSPALNRIECGKETLQIEPRVMWVLVCLASRPNEVLSRATLFDVVWADSVVCEEALTRTVSELRRIFHDDPRNPRVIETIRKGGYRLIAPVMPASTLEPSQWAQEISPGQPHLNPKSRRRWLGISSLAIVTLLLFSFWGSRWLTPTPIRWETRPLTSYPGLEFFPALSPDGSMVALSWAGEDPPEGDPLDIYVMKINNGSPVRLTTLPLCEYFPSWSPDGTEIAFSNEEEDRFEICTVPVLGGSIRRLAQVESPIIGLDWSPDGRSIVYSSSDDSSAIPRIHLLSLSDLTRRTLTTPQPRGEGDIEPAFSPDGRSVAFIRINELQEQDAYIVSTDGGRVQKLDMEGERVSGIDWMSQNEMIVLATSKSGYGVWRVSMDSNERIPLSKPRGPAQRPSVGPHGKHLVYEELSFARDIWCFDILGARDFRKRPEPLIASTLSDSKPVFSPDGRFIAFVSDRSGSPEIWITDVEGGNPQRLTDDRATQMMRPSWSPEGKELAYSSNKDGLLSIYITSLESRISRRLLQGGPHILSLWSRSGDTLYYQGDAASGWEVWRIHADGSGRSLIAEAGYTIIDETPDARALLCLKTGAPGIWRLPVDGTEASLLVSEELCGNWDEIAAAEDGLYFIHHGRETSTLGFYDFAAGRADSLAGLPLYATSPTISPDGTMLLYDCLGDIESDLMLVEFSR